MQRRRSNSLPTSAEIQTLTRVLLMTLRCQAGSYGPSELLAGAAVCLLGRQSGGSPQMHKTAWGVE